MSNFNESATATADETQDLIGKMLLDIARPDGEHVRLAVLLGTIDNGRLRLIRASDRRLEPERIAGIALEEFAKVAGAADDYRKALGLHDPLEGVR